MIYSTKKIDQKATKTCFHNLLKKVVYLYSRKMNRDFSNSEFNKEITLFIKNDITVLYDKNIPSKITSQLSTAEDVQLINFLFI